MLEALIALLFGLLIGSFLNVCIHRMPRDLSVVRPRSRCPSCDRQIAWYDNIPLVSYLMLYGRCRHCRARIPWRYPAVEALTGALCFGIVLAMGPTVEAAKLCLLNALLVGLLFTDLEERILPDEFTLGGLLAAVGLAWFVPVRDFLGRAALSLYGVEWGPNASSVAEAVFGAAVPAGFLWLAGFLFEKIRHKQGLGLGDVKMVAMIGAFLGIRGALLVLVVGSVTGSVVGLLYIALTRKDSSTYELPFGTFLGVAGIAVSLYLGVE
jgi:leader peptidase (prepilin peptidase)/N-methyltransferase